MLLPSGSHTPQQKGSEPLRRAAPNAKSRSDNRPADSAKIRAYPAAAIYVDEQRTQLLLYRRFYIFQGRHIRDRGLQGIQNDRLQNKAKAHEAAVLFRRQCGFHRDIRWTRMNTTVKLKPERYRLNVNDDKIRPLYERFKRWKGIPKWCPCSDDERREFEAWVTTKKGDSK